MWNFETVFAVLAVVLMSVVSILSGYVAYASIKNTVNMFSFYLVFSLIYFVFLFAVKHLCGNHSLDLLLCTSATCTMSVTNCQAQKYLDILETVFLFGVFLCQMHFISVFVFVID